VLYLFVPLVLARQRGLPSSSRAGRLIYTQCTMKRCRWPDRTIIRTRPRTMMERSEDEGVPFSTRRSQLGGGRGTGGERQNRRVRIPFSLSPVFLSSSSSSSSSSLFFLLPSFLPPPSPSPHPFSSLEKSHGASPLRSLSSRSVVTPRIARARARAFSARVIPR